MGGNLVSLTQMECHLQAEPHQVAISIQLVVKVLEAVHIAVKMMEQVVRAREQLVALAGHEELPAQLQETTAAIMVVVADLHLTLMDLIGLALELVVDIVKKHTLQEVLLLVAH